MVPFRVCDSFISSYSKKRKNNHPLSITYVTIYNRIPTNETSIHQVTSNVICIKANSNELCTLSLKFCHKINGNFPTHTTHNNIRVPYRMYVKCTARVNMGWEKI